jgi:ribose/xylose/arabinose/galactoside ABC-type transport system permease subunit
MSMPVVASGDTAAWADKVRRFVVRFTPELLLLLMVIVLAIANPATVRLQNLSDIIINAAPIAVLALAAMWVLVSGGLDLSAGYGVAMCALLVGGAIEVGQPLPVALLLGVAGGAALGLVNGLLVGLVGMPPFIATLATMAAVQGIVLLLGGQGTVIISDPVIATIGSGRLFGVPWLVIIALLAAGVVYLIAQFTSFGVHTYGLGSNRTSMTARGVPVIWRTVQVYVFSGVLVAITAILLVAKVQIVDTSIASTTTLMDAFAATIIGGTSLFGGRGTVRGTLVGALLISFISTSLVVLGISPNLIQFFKGLIIVAAVVIDALIRLAEKKSA